MVLNTGPATGGEEDGRKKRARSPEFYEARVTEDGRINWRGMVLTHIKDLDDVQRSKVIEEIRRLREQGFGRDRIQKTVAEKISAYIPITILIKLMRGDLDIDWSRSRIRGPYREYRKREMMYERVLELKALGYGYYRIAKEIEREFGERLSLRGIYRWCKGMHSPSGNIKKIEVTPDVCWLVGLVIADGSITQYFRRNYRTLAIIICTTDEEIVEKVNAMNLGYVHIYFDSHVFRITIKSKLMADLVEEIRGLIDQARYDELIAKMGDVGVKAFIRGFFDGDGSGLFVYFGNSDLKLLEFIRHSLRRFGIEMSQPVLTTKRGMSSYYGQKGEWIVRRKDVYKVFVYPDHYDRFFELIGTTLKRKVRLVVISMKTLQQHSRKYGCSYIEEIRRRYENNEDWADVLVYLVKSVGARMRKRRKSSTPSFPSNSSVHV